MGEHTGALVGKQRIEAMTEGIYAIALTLLVLDLKLPSLPHGADNAALLHALRELLPKALTWMLSFWVMVLFWLAQVRLYRFCTGLDWTIVRLELAMLAFVSLLPFSTALQGEYGTLQAACVIYSGNLFVLALLSSMRSWHLLRTPALHGPGLAGAVARRLRLRAWLMLACVTATLVLAFFWPAWNMLAMLPSLFLPPLTDPAASRSAASGAAPPA